jgi:hypothetical protein
MKMKTWYYAVLACVSVTLYEGAYFAYFVGVHHASATTYNCVAGPNELCASDQYYEDMMHFKALQKDLAKRQVSSEIRAYQDEHDLVTGLASRLFQQEQATVGCGAPQDKCRWDDQKSKFVPAPKEQVVVPNKTPPK